MSAQFANLTNGIACAPDGARLMRLQSTWCEQKRWSDILWTLPADFYAFASDGADLVVHDQSERARLTRAQWQGLSWVRYALRTAWGLPEAAEFARNGMNVTGYWRSVWAQTDKRTRSYLDYFAPKGVPIALAVKACDCARVRVIAGTPTNSH